MQCDAVERDQETKGGEHDGRDPPSLFPDSLFKAGVGAFDDGFEIFVHSGLREFGLGGGVDLNGADPGGGFMFPRTLPLSAFPRRSEYLSCSRARLGFEGETRLPLWLITDSVAFLGPSCRDHAAIRSSCGAGEDGCEPTGARSGGGVRARISVVGERASRARACGWRRPRANGKCRSPSRSAVDV